MANALDRRTLLVKPSQTFDKPLTRLRGDPHDARRGDCVSQEGESPRHTADVSLFGVRFDLQLDKCLHDELDCLAQLTLGPSRHDQVVYKMRVKQSCLINAQITQLFAGRKSTISTFLSSGIVKLVVLLINQKDYEHFLSRMDRLCLKKDRVQIYGCMDR